MRSDRPTTPLGEALRAASPRVRDQLARQLGLTLPALYQLDARDTARWLRREIAAALRVPESDLFRS